MRNEKPEKYPFPMSHPFYEHIIDTIEADAKKMGEIWFISVFGTIFHISSWSSPEICTAGTMIATFQLHVRLTHYNILQHVFPYLVSTEDYGILLLIQNDKFYVLCWN